MEREFYYDDQWHNQPQDDPYTPAAAAPAGGQQYPWWTEPGAPPAWMTDLSHSPGELGVPTSPGQYWDWAGDHWEMRASPGQPPRTTSPTPTAPTPNYPTTPGPTGPTGGDFDYSAKPLNLGRAPGMLPFPDYESAGSFDFDPYLPSNWEDAEKEPGFSQSQDRLSKQVQNSAAYQGVLRSGATIGRLDSVLDSNRGQNFAQFDARRFRNWEANTGMKLNAFDRRVGDVDRKNNYKFNVADRSFSDELQRWQEQVRSLTSLATPK